MDAFLEDGEAGEYAASLTDDRSLTEADIADLRRRADTITAALPTAKSRLLAYASHDAGSMTAALRYLDGLGDGYDARCDLEDALNAAAAKNCSATATEAIRRCANAVDGVALLLDQIHDLIAGVAGVDYVGDEDVASFMATMAALPPDVPAHRPDVDGLVEFTATPRPSEPLIPGLMGCGESGMVIGAPGCGKSTLTTAMCLAVATGSAWLGQPTKASGVVYVAAEDAKGVEARARAWCAKHGFNIEDVPFCVIDRSFDLANADSAKRLASSIEAIQISKQWIIRLCVIDTLAKCMTEDENSTEVAGRVVTNIGYVRKRTGVSVLALHHHDKKGSGSRGSTALPGDADLIISVARGTATVKKRRNGLDGWKFGFQIVPVMAADGSTIGPVIDLTTEAETKTTDPAPTAAPSEDDGFAALVGGVGSAAAAGRPFKLHQAGGLYERRDELPAPLSSMGRNKLVDLGKAAIAAGALINNGGLLTVPARH